MLLWALLISQLGSVTMTASAGENCLVGVYYFAGWWREMPNKYHTAGKDWRPEWPGRLPTLGEYNEQRTMDREIVAAADHGVDFFQILWYPQNAEAKANQPHSEKLNEGLRTFMASLNARRMKFTVEYVNHAPFVLATDAEWEAGCREWIEAMKHPSYLQVGGRPVFVIHSMFLFQQQNGDDPKRVAARLVTLKRIARESGLPEPLIGGGMNVGWIVTGPTVAPYDFLKTYNEIPNLPQKEEVYPYAEMLKCAEDAWQWYAKHSEKPYVPYLPAGWDPRPWKDARPSFAMPTREEWTDALKRVKTALDTNTKFGIPTGKGRQKAFLIYAWNEFGEGGIVAPSKGEETMKLEAIKNVFGVL